MIWSTCSARPAFSTRFARLSFITLAILATSLASVAGAQTDQTGSIAGRVIDDQGAPLANAQVAIPGTTIGTQTRADGGYVLPRVPVGSHSLQARMLGFRPESAPVQV